MTSRRIRLFFSVIELDPVLSPIFGPVHGHIGHPQQILLTGRIFRVQGDADARSYADFLIPKVERLMDHFQEPPGQLLDFRSGPGVVQDDEEFISSQTEETVSAPEFRLDTYGKLGKQLVPRFMPQRVVHLLEPVEIEEQKDQNPPVSPSHGQISFELPFESGPVRKPRQGIMERQKTELLFLPAFTGDIRFDGHQTHQRLVFVEDRGDPDFRQKLRPFPAPVQKFSAGG